MERTGRVNLFALSPPHKPNYGIVTNDWFRDSVFMDCTPALQRALEAASIWARKLGNEFVDSRALLLALLEEDEGHAARILQSGGIAAAKARRLVLEFPGPAEFDSLTRLMAEARSLAQELSGERQPGTSHAALAALRVSPHLERQFTQAGFAWDRAVATLGSTSSDRQLSLDEPLQWDLSVEELQTSRVIDVNANRAGEALRVIEDYCRFLLADRTLTQETKDLRHRLAEVLSAIRPDVSARDTQNDVGTRLSVSGELHRESPWHVAQVNLKRLQECLRSLEEYAKVLDARVSREIEQIRYRAYTLEKAILRGADARWRLANARLYLLVTASACRAEVDFVVREAVAGGVDLVQLREKNLTDRELLRRAERLRQLTLELGVLFIVNDRPDIARVVRADGVHLGQDDLPVEPARLLVGPKALVGVSTHNVDQLRAAICAGADYVGIGPVFASTTKGFAELAGLDYVRRATSESTLPMFALGGITLDNLTAVVDAGARRIAVSAAICSADEPRPVAAAFRQMLDKISPRSCGSESIVG
jgi:thiamine-phosphate pyrophosphorylase